MSDSTTNSGIYIIRNLKNGKFYLGQAQDIRQRWQAHRCALRGNYHRNSHLQAAWNKYGEGSFKFLVVEYCAVDRLDEREQVYLDNYAKGDNCYNIALDAAASMRGRNHTAETLKKISEAAKGNQRNVGRIVSQETRTKISEAQRGKYIPDETRRKLSAVVRNNIENTKRLKKMNEERKGKSLSDEHRRKISEAGKGRVVSEESRRKSSEKQKGRVITAEHRAKLSEAGKRYYASKREQQDED